jgi:hypothetical protein
VRRRRPVEQEELEPAGGADFVVGRRSDGAGVAAAGKCREDRALAHAVPVGAGDDAEQRGLHIRGAARGDGDSDALAVGPILVCDREGWLREA